MHVTYAPEDPTEGDPQEWDFDLKRIRSRDAEQIEKAFGGSWDEFEGALQVGNVKARRAMLWHLLRQQHPLMQLRDVPDFYTGELVVQYTVAELVVLRERVESVRGDEERKELMLAALDAELVAARVREGLPAEPDVIDGEVVVAGKAHRPSRNSPTSTG